MVVKKLKYDSCLSYYTTNIVRLKIITMKKLLYFIFFLFFITGCSCKKQVTDSNGLPLITQEGKNTVGFKVNGKVWIPYSPCGFSQDPCGTISMRYNLPNAPAYYLDFGCLRKDGNHTSQLVVASYTTIPIATIGNKYDSINVSYNDGWTTYSQSYNPKGNFTITKIDFTNQIISGTFECTLYSATDSVVITDGRFDCKFYTCICNN
jgi:hypothetical protein